MQRRERDEQNRERRSNRRCGQRCGKREAACQHERPAPPAVGEEEDRRLDGDGDGGRYREQQADLAVREAEVVADRRPRGLARTEDELVDELDREQDDDEAGGSAPAAGNVLPGRMRASHRASVSTARTAARKRPLTRG